MKLLTENTRTLNQKEVAIREKDSLEKRKQQKNGGTPQRQRHRESKPWRT